MSWDVRTTPDAVVVYRVYCSTCGFNRAFTASDEAERCRREHWQDHDELWDTSGDYGFGLKNDPKPEVDWDFVREMVEASERNDIRELCKNNAGSLIELLRTLRIGKEML